MAKYGFMGIPVPKEYGGQGCDTLTYAMCVEELSKVCATTGVIVSANTSLCIDPITVSYTHLAGKDYIKWVDFTVSYEALCQAYDWDVDTFDTEHHVEWIPLLAYTAARTGGEFDKKALKILNETAEKLVEGEAEIETLTKDMKSVSYTHLDVYKRQDSRMPVK